MVTASEDGSNNGDSGNFACDGLSPETIQSIEEWYNGKLDPRQIQVVCMGSQTGGAVGALGGFAVGGAIGSAFGAALDAVLGTGASTDGSTGWFESIFGGVGQVTGSAAGYNVGSMVGTQIASIFLLDASTSYENMDFKSSRADKVNKCYALLGVSATSNKKDILSAYRRKALEFHPDKNKESGSNAKMLEVNLCKEIVLLANTGKSSRNQQGDEL